MRKAGALALVALLTLIPADAASAKSKSKSDAFAAKHQLKGKWRGKDADKDGLKNSQEFKLGTNPRKPDSDKDGLRDGDELRSRNDPRKPDTDGDGIRDGREHAGVVIAFDGETITVREFASRRKITATLETACTPAATDADADAEDDGGYVDVTEEEVIDDADTGSVDDDGEEETIDLGPDTAACDDEDLEEGVVLKSAELKGRFLVAYEIA